MRQTDVFRVRPENPFPAVYGPRNIEALLPRQGRGKRRFFCQKMEILRVDHGIIGFGQVSSCIIVHSADETVKINCAEAGRRGGRFCSFLAGFE